MRYRRTSPAPSVVVAVVAVVVVVVVVLLLLLLPPPPLLLGGWGGAECTAHNHILKYIDYGLCNKFIRVLTTIRFYLLQDG